MEWFKNILVGVDLSEVDRLVAEKPAGPSEAAIQRALGLARANDAKIRFMSVLDSSTLQLPSDERELPETIPDRTTVVSRAGDILSKSVDEARRQGVTAEHQVTFGKAWVELIREVLRNDHDLLIAGTRRFGPFRSMLLGSTGMKLLRQCPCPVWITQPQPERIASILVAHDLEPVGDLAMELAGSLAREHDAQLHVFHALRLPAMDDMFPGRVSAQDLATSRANAQKHIAGQLERFPLSRSPEVHIESGSAYSGILKLIERHQIELLVMGTVARTGVAGVITGNTAENLLPHIPCSVLAVKPSGFQSPVRLE